MNRNSMQQWIVRSLPIGLILASLVGEPVHAWASTRVRFNPPAGGAPRETKGGASRGNIACVANFDQKPLQITLLPPQATQTQGSASQDPTLLVHLPPNKAQKAVFHLKASNGKSRYRDTLSVPQQGGILRIPLPLSLPALEPHPAYEWEIILYCNGKLQTDNPFARGSIRRTQVSSNQSLRER